MKKLILKNKIIKKTTNYYENNLNKFGNNFKGMNWSSKKSQYLRFSELIKIGNLNKKSIQDIGCGNGEFVNFLNNKRINFSNYIGTDISAEMINIAKKNFISQKKAKFKNHNIITDRLIISDYVVSSGIFNVRMSYQNKQWEDYVFSIISRMFDSSKIANC